MFTTTETAATHPARKRMKALGITSHELARRAETHQPTISHWLNGRRGLSKSVGQRVAKALGVTLEKVLVDWDPARLSAKARR